MARGAILLRAGLPAKVGQSGETGGLGHETLSAANWPRASAKFTSRPPRRPRAPGCRRTNPPTPPAPEPRRLPKSRPTRAGADHGRVERCVGIAGPGPRLVRRHGDGKDSFPALAGGGGIARFEGNFAQGQQRLVAVTAGECLRDDVFQELPVSPRTPSSNHFHAAGSTRPR